MTLRNGLGGSVRDLFDEVNSLLDSEDALIVLFDGRRTVTYSHGFAASPSQIELLGVEIERSMRRAVGRQSTDRKDRRNRDKGNEIGDRGNGAGDDQHLRRADGGSHNRVADIGDQSIRSGDFADGDRRRAAGRVLRLAGENAQPNLG
jgi:hypothetical protein